MTWQAYYSEKRGFEKDAAQPAHGTMVVFGSALEPGQSIEKKWSFYPSERETEKRYLVFVIDAKDKVDEVSEENNTFVLDTWTFQPAGTSSQDDLQKSPHARERSDSQK